MDGTYGGWDDLTTATLQVKIYDLQFFLPCEIFRELQSTKFKVKVKVDGCFKY